jgi:two-component system, cell cycle response regulator DivK
MMTVPGSTVRTGGSDPSAPLILIVDDNDRNRKLAGDALRAAGLRTIDTARGGEAIALAAERQPHVILLDLRLPDMDGIEVAAGLRDRPETADIPIVALSALHQADESHLLAAAGFAGYIPKPIDVRAFPEQVRGYCRRADD